MTALAASTIRRPVILVFVEIFKIEVIVFIGYFIMYLTSH
jgi:hypothetical protein